MASTEPSSAPTAGAVSAISPGAPGSGPRSRDGRGAPVERASPAEPSRCSWGSATPRVWAAGAPACPRRICDANVAVRCWDDGRPEPLRKSGRETGGRGPMTGLLARGTSASRTRPTASAIPERSAAAGQGSDTETSPGGGASKDGPANWAGRGGHPSDSAAAGVSWAGHPRPVTGHAPGRDPRRLNEPSRSSARAPSASSPPPPAVYRQGCPSP